MSKEQGIKRSLGNLTIGRKLTFTFGVIISLGIVGFAISARATSQYLNESTTTGALARKSVDDTEDAQLTFHNMGEATFGYVFSQDPSFLKKREAIDAEADSRFEKVRTDIEGLPNNGELLAAWDAASKYDEENCGPIEDRLLELTEAGEVDKAKALYRQTFEGNLEKFTSLQQVLADKVRAYSDREDREYANQARAAINIGWILQGILVAISILIGGLLTRSLSGRLSHLAKVAQELSRGDANQNVGSLGRDEVGQVGSALHDLVEYQRALAKSAEMVAACDLTEEISLASDKDLLGSAFRNMRDSLEDVLRTMNRSSASVAETSATLADDAKQNGNLASDIASSSVKLANQATEVSAVIEELAASIDTIAQGSRMQTQSIASAVSGLGGTMRAVESVSTSALEMASVAENGRNSVQQSVDAIERVRQHVQVSTTKVNRLDAKGREIGAIVKSIEAIAEQTNLLALNAAIEAARAGQHGRGFAVVADEVRKLSEQAANATKEIAALVEDVRSTVKETVTAIQATEKEVIAGTETSREAGAALQQIVATAETVSGNANELSKLTNEVEALMVNISHVASENQHSTQEMAEGATQVASTMIAFVNVGGDAATGAEQLSNGVRDTARAADDLREMSREVRKLVGKFQLTESDSAEPVVLRLAA